MKVEINKGMLQKTASVFMEMRKRTICSIQRMNRDKEKQIRLRIKINSKEILKRITPALRFNFQSKSGVKLENTSKFAILFSELREVRYIRVEAGEIGETRKRSNSRQVANDLKNSVKKQKNCKRVSNMVTHRRAGGIVCMDPVLENSNRKRSKMGNIKRNMPGMISRCINKKMSDFTREGFSIYKTLTSSKNR